jgi:hypothetical protein
MLQASPSAAQVLIIDKPIAGGCRVWFGDFVYYPPMAPRPYHGPSLYADYGVRRLEGRILALPGGMSPPGPQAIDRYTIAKYERASSAPLPRRPTTSARYPHGSYISRMNRPRYAH